MSHLRDIVDLARWAPSGDNSQPWRFRIEEPDRLVVFAHDTRATCVYDLDGHSSQIAVGTLLETIALAATRFELVATAERRVGSPDDRPVFDVSLRHDATLAEDPLVREIERRRVQRRPLRMRALSTPERSLLEVSVGGRFELRWFTGIGARARVAWLCFQNGRLRAELPEAYALHRDVIEWHASFSEDRIPDGAIGADLATLAVMRWALARPQRVSFLNRYLGGSVLSGAVLDLIPGLACAGHCVLLAPTPLRKLDDYLVAGRALQRFWLTASSLDLQFQPLYTPLVFARYTRERVGFTSHARSIARSRRTFERVQALLGCDDEERAVFMGRIGAGRAAAARSTRLPIERLLVGDEEAASVR